MVFWGKNREMPENGTDTHAVSFQIEKTRQRVCQRKKMMV